MTPRIALVRTLLALAIATPFVLDTPNPWPRKKTQPDASQGAVVAQVLGIDTWVQFAYHRPALRDRDVWTAKNAHGGPTVPRNGEPYPWRAGANEVTTFEASADVRIEGLDVPKGKYALFMIPGDKFWTVVLNKQLNQAGSGRDYDAEHDLLRFKVAPQRAPKTEFLTYAFNNCEAWSTMASMQWGKIRIAFEIDKQPTR